MIFWIATILLVLLSMIFIIVVRLPKLITSSLLVIIVVLSYGIYWHYGSAAKLPEYYSAAVQKTLKQHIELRPLMRDLHKKSFHLRLQLENNVKDAALWQQLATTYMLLYKIEQGVDAFKQAYVLLPEDRNIAVTYIKALNMLALSAYQEENYQLALATWGVLETELANNKLLNTIELNKLRTLLAPLKVKAQDKLSN
ncbi:MAG: hypothetical protein COC15_02220 [Legionellales bacterium]|nr:MAG: hypothetical protein COC15_02220 [Legionellales bacterium]